MVKIRIRAEVEKQMNQFGDLKNLLYDQPLVQERILELTSDEVQDLVPEVVAVGIFLAFEQMTISGFERHSSILNTRTHLFYTIVDALLLDRKPVSEADQINDIIERIRSLSIILGTQHQLFNAMGNR